MTVSKILDGPSSTLPDVEAPEWRVAVDVIRGHPATAGLAWDVQNGLAQLVVDALDEEHEELRDERRELLEGWKELLGREKVPGYVVAAAPDWLVERFGLTRSHGSAA